MQGQFGIPGSTTALTSYENQFIWGGDVTKVQVIMANVIVSGAARDAGATPTTVLRSGLIMGRISATGLLIECDPTATDGSQVPVGILNVELLAVDPLTQVATNRAATIVALCPVKAANIYIMGVALIGHAYEFQMRRQLVALGFKFDDDLSGAVSGTVQRVTTKATDYTVLASDNGTLFQATTADCNFTLPAIQAGLEYEFVMTADFELAVTSAEGDNLLVGNDASADSITFTTAGEQIGARVAVKCRLVDGTLKWVVELPHTPFGTGAATLTYAIAT